MKKIILVLAIFFSVHSFAQTVGDTFADNGINYIVTKATLPYEVAVGNNTGFIGDAIIPDSIISSGNTFAVTTISQGAFQLCYGLTSVSIPDSVTSIGQNAFENCEFLFNVEYTGFLNGGNGSLTSIGDYAFAGCLVLDGISIPPSVSSIGDFAFAGCQVADSIYIPASVSSIGEGAFGGCISSTDIYFQNRFLDDSTIPLEIGENVFNSCTSLTSVTIPDFVTILGGGAFANCTGLTDISISIALNVIGDYTFYGCSGLTSVSIPCSINTIGQSAFYGCTGLTSVIIGSPAEFQGIDICAPIESIGQEAFAGCTSLTSIIIPDSVTFIGQQAFENCNSLTSVTIPDSVNDIGIGAFAGCASLTSVTVNWQTPFLVDYYAFQGLTLSNITLNVPAGTAAAYEATAVWTDFNPISEPIVAPFIGQTFTANGINYIVTKDTLPYEVAVGNNQGFLGIATIPALVSNLGNSFTVTSIVNNAFIRCIGLTSVSIPTSVTTIGNGVFADCTSLTSATIPNSVTSIGDNAFLRCTGLTSVTIPNSVTSIGTGAFLDCSSLTSITIPNSVLSIGSNTFVRCTSLTSVTIPNSVTTIGQYAFSYCTNLTSVSISNSVTSIGFGAFSYTGITSVTVDWTTPIVINSAVFAGLTLSNIILNVPTGTEIAYENTLVWTDFNIPFTIPTTLTFCQGAKVSDAVGTTSMKFYTALTGGSLLLNTATLTNRTLYATLTVSGIESSPRVPVVITINPLPTEVLGALTSDTVSITTTTGFAPATLAVGQFVGTTTPISYRIPTFTGVGLSYLWSVPADVTIVGASNTNVLTVHYNNVAAGAGVIGAIKVQAVNTNTCAGAAKSITVSKVLPTAPSSIRMTNEALPLPLSGVQPAITTFAPYMGTTTELTLTARPVATATSYVWELPTGVVVTNGSATTVGGVTESTSNEITVNFSGVTNTNTFNYMTTAAVPVSTNNLRIGVYSKNGTGLSTTNNAALANSSLLFTPNNTSTARLLTLTALRPVAPTSLKIYNPLVSATVAVTDISKFVGTPTELTLTATVSRLASSYSWEIPSTVTVVAGSDLTSNSITINFLNVPAGTSSLYLGVKAVNGIGSSVTVNPTTLVPATTSEARLLKVTAIAPSIVGTVTGSLRICPSIASDVIYTIATAATRANTYNVTVPMGCTINGGTTNTATITAIPGATFTVNYPALFIANATTSIKKIFIQSENGFGVSTTNKSLSLTNVSAVCTPRLADSAVANEFSVIAYPNPSSESFTIQTSAKGAVSVKVYDMQGRLVENTDSTQVGSRLAAGTYNVIVNQGTKTKSVRVIKK